MKNPPQPLPTIIGKNVQRLRGDHSMEQLANIGRGYGASWSAGSISAIERGNFRATIETLALLCFSLQAFKEEGERVFIGDLLQTDQPYIEITEAAYLTVEELTDWLAGERLRLRIPDPFNDIAKALQETAKHYASLNTPPGTTRGDIRPATKPTTTERRAAKNAGIDPIELGVWSRYLWSTSFEQRRDELAGPGATAQKKGHISRDLQAEILQAMADNGDD